MESVFRGADEIEIALDDGSKHRFDHVVIAAHADQALAMLAEPTTDEAELLGSWQYSVNDTWLHTDHGVDAAPPGGVGFVELPHGRCEP